MFFYGRGDCVFGICDDDGLRMDPKKVKAIFEWPTLENVSEVRSFHGLASFYRKFIRNFSSICNAMIETMRWDKKDFKWTHGADTSFETLKQKVVELPILALPDFNKVFQVECDASGNAIGVVLSQNGKPVAFFSENLNDAKRKCTIVSPHIDPLNTNFSLGTWISLN